MTTLDANDRYFVVINTFSVAPEDADQLLQSLIDITERDVIGRPGFVSANFHKSRDGKYVTNYAQWRSKENLDAMMSDRLAGQLCRTRPPSPRGSSPSSTIWSGPSKRNADTAAQSCRAALQSGAWATTRAPAMSTPVSTIGETARRPQ